MVTNVCDIERQFAGEGMLDAQCPVFNVGRAKIEVHGEGVALSWVRSDSVAALNKPRDIGGINLSLLINPVKAPRDVDPGAENVSNGRRGDRGNGAVATHVWGRWPRYNRGPSANDREAKHPAPPFPVS